jgi:nanoRNase/pAp phosphatase (c-di-AMP/oligoRNAs hydrolase)
MEGSEITLERLRHVTQGVHSGQMRDQVFAAHVGEAPREDLVPYVADFLLQLEDVKWSVVSGIVGDRLVVSVRNLGYSRNAGEFVKRWFNDIGSAGGHRAMAKAVVPLDAFRTKFHPVEDSEIASRLADLAARFLREPQHGERRAPGRSLRTPAKLRSHGS